MKTSKLVRAIAVTAILTIFTGCSEDMLTPSDISYTKTENIESSVSIPKKIFTQTLKLGPYETYSFDFSNTGFYKFNSIFVTDCAKLHKNYEISGYDDDQAIVLECDSRNINVASITIQNITSQTIEVEIYLTGSDKKIKVRDNRDIRAE